MKTTMKFSDMKILLTGATGGIGYAIAAELLKQGASLVLTGHSEQQLQMLKQKLQSQAKTPDQVDSYTADLMKSEELEQLAEYARQRQVNVLINNAGIMQFGLFNQQDGQYTEQLIRLNTLAPMLLTQHLLTHLQQQPAAQIINVGSTFGSIGYPGFASYSASKSAIQGFSEALSRELAETTVDVKYLSPRATRTDINSPTVMQMNQELKVAMDSPDVVAQALVRLLLQSGHQLNIGWPEKLFIRINKLFPALVDKAIAKQWPVIKRHALSVNA